MAQKCVHKGCGKEYTDEDEDCIYHPGPPVFHEGQKGWKCCKPRVLTFDEFLSIPPCTTGKHSTTDEVLPPAPSEREQAAQSQGPPPPVTRPIASSLNGDNTLSGSLPSRPPQAATAPPPEPSPAPPPESESDDPSLPIAVGLTCKRRGCGQEYKSEASRDEEECVYHPGHALFHEGSKGWTCCKRRVLEFDEFMKIEGCKRKKRHLFIGKAKDAGEEKVETVRNDFYQTATTIIASFFLKKIDKEKARVHFSSSSTVDLDLPTSDNKRYVDTIHLYAPIDPEKSSFKVMGTKLELTLVKADGSGWPVLKSSDPRTGEIIQVGRAGRA